MHEVRYKTGLVSPCDHRRGRGNGLRTKVKITGLSNNGLQAVNELRNSLIDHIKACQYLYDICAWIRVLLREDSAQKAS
jgi:hypothetical protein